MPDLIPSKRRPLPQRPLANGGDLPGYVELHCKSNFTFLEGASHPDELVQQAAALGYQGLALTDRHSLAGVVRAHVAAQEVGLPLVIGAEVHPLNAPPLVLWVTDRLGYGQLARLLTVGRRRADKGSCTLYLNDLAEHAAGLIAGLLPPWYPARGSSLKDPLDARTEPSNVAVEPDHWKRLAQCLGPYQEIYADRLYQIMECHCGPEEDAQLTRLAKWADQAAIPLVPANDVHYHLRERQQLQDVLTAIRHKCTVPQATPHLFANAQRHLKSPLLLAEQFAAWPQAMHNTLAICQQCRFSLDELRYEYPEELAPAGQTPLEYLHGLTWAGARERYPNGIPEKVRSLIEHELVLIAELRYEAYFLTVRDLVVFARSKNILCQGRGSAANSAVCYALGITSVDPEQMDLLFERFVSRERNEAPDIDVDFEHERREEVLQYLYGKYGRDRAGMTAEVITYRPRSAVRDVGKALGLSLDCVDRLAKNLEGMYAEPALAPRFKEAGLDPDSDLGRQLVSLVQELVGFPRHLSQHVGGMVMTRGPLCELVPIENAAMPGRTVIEWDKDDLDDLGILKVDCLALGMLTAIHKCFDLVRQHVGPLLTLANIPTEDPDVYAMIGRADTMGVFQIESRAQMSMLPRLKPVTFYDLVIEVAIVRPGPIQGNMVHPYLRRRAGLEAVEYPNEAVREVLHKTLGVPLFQEQAMRLAMVAAGFSPGEADQLRRAMGAWRRPGIIDQFRQKLLAGMQAQGYSQAFAEQVFNQIRGFGEYGFPESHAASFALLVYVSCWLKHYYPVMFTASLINSQPMGFYAPAQLVRDLQEHGLEVRPTDLRHSDWDCTIEPGTNQAWALRLGLRMVSGLSQEQAQKVVAARRQKPFSSVEDLAARAQVNQATVQRLARAGCLQSLATDRRQALWQALAVTQEEFPLLSDDAADEPEVALPAPTLAEEILEDYRTQGLSLKAHPLEELRPQLAQLGAVPASDLKTLEPGKWVCVAGLVLLRQRPSTAKGVTFVTLEDETGFANLLVRPEIWERYRIPARRAAAMLVHGRLERQGQVIHVLTQKIEDLTARLQAAQGFSPKSRDFR